MSKNVQDVFRRTVTKHVVREWEENGKQFSQSVATVVVDYCKMTLNGEPSPQGEGIKHVIDIGSSRSDGFISVEDWPLVVAAASEAIAESLPPLTGNEALFLSDSPAPTSIPVGGWIVYQTNGETRIRRSDGTDEPWPPKENP